jgi:hypothetical protein
MLPGAAGDVNRTISNAASELPPPLQPPSNTAAIRAASKSHHCAGKFKYDILTISRASGLGEPKAVQSGDHATDCGEALPPSRAPVDSVGLSGKPMCILNVMERCTFTNWRIYAADAKATPWDA